jgi:twitching motility protein PilT
MIQAGGALGMHTLDQDLRRLVEDGRISLSLAKSYAADPKSLDEARVRPRELSSDAWSMQTPEPASSGWGH